MRICRKRLTTGAEIEIVAYGAFVTDPSYISRDCLILAKRAIAEDTIVDLMILRRLRYSLIKWSKSMTRMSIRCM